MTTLWAQLLPVLLATMVSPARTLAVIVLLRTPAAWRTASAFVLGMVLIMVLQGVVLGLGMSLLGLASSDRAEDLAVVAGVLYVVGGVLLLTGALRFALAEPSQGDGKLGAMMRKLQTVQPAQALRVGGGWLLASPKQWVFVNTAVAVIYTADLAPAGAVGVFSVFTVLSQLVYLLVIVGFLVARQRITPVLDSAFTWIGGHLRRIVIVVFGALGVLLLVSGIAALA